MTTNREFAEMQDRDLNRAINDHFQDDDPDQEENAELQDD